MIFRPGTLSRGWRSVALAVSADKERPVLTGIFVEQYKTGLRLVATDSYMLLHTFIPNVTAEHEYTPDPGLDEAPTATAIVADPHGRGRGLLAHAAQLDAKDEITEIRVDLGVVAVENEDAPSFAGMEPRWCVIEINDRERVQLQLIEGEFPSWRNLEITPTGLPTTQIALAPEIVGRLAKLGKINEETRIGWSFTGEDRPVRINLIDSFPFIAGLAMPCRWDLNTDAPEAPAPAGDSTSNPDPADEDPDRLAVVAELNDRALYNQARAVVVKHQLGSTSLIQRSLRIGFARAGRLMDMLSEQGVVGPPAGDAARQVLMTPAQLAAITADQDD